MKNIPFGDGVVLVVLAIVVKCPVGEVFLAVATVLVINIKGKTLPITSSNGYVWNTIGDLKNNFRVISTTNYLILSFSWGRQYFFKKTALIIHKTLKK